MPKLVEILILEGVRQAREIYRLPVFFFFLICFSAAVPAKTALSIFTVFMSNKAFSVKKMPFGSSLYQIILTEMEYKLYLKSNCFASNEKFQWNVYI